MTFSKISPKKKVVPTLLLSGLCLFFSTMSCKPTGSGSGSDCIAANFSGATKSNVGSATAGGNVMQVTVNGNLCGDAKYQYANEICTQVTLCDPRTPTKCQTISNILLDTGSFGLRIFDSVIDLKLVSSVNSGQTLAECVQYADGSTQWGPVQYAYVQLGGEPAVYMPIHVINSGFATPAGNCAAGKSNPDVDPKSTGFNGILGVGMLKQDCGTTCETDENNGQYFTCNGTNCSCGATVAANAQVQNPVSLLPKDKNGVILTLNPVASSSGVTQVTGSLYLGIETQTNNTKDLLLSSAKIYVPDKNGLIRTTFPNYSNFAIVAFLDSGSNGLFFPFPVTAPLLPDCSTDHGDLFAGFACPASVTSYIAAIGAVGTPNTNFNFDVGNAYNLLTNSNGYRVFNNLAVDVSSALSSSTKFFDWGLPFFFGRTVGVGIIEEDSVPFGKGPYWVF